MNLESFYVVEKETGAESNNIPLWANKMSNPANLADEHLLKPEFKKVDEVPGAFQLLNILSKQECESLIGIAESLSFNKDAAVSLPRNIRHNDSLTWVVDEATDSIIWRRSKPLLANGVDVISNLVPVGLNARFRFYKYDEGDFFKPHIDGSWPGSRIINGKNTHDAYGDRWSQMTFLIFLSEDFKGGETQFWVNKNTPTKPADRSENAKLVKVRTPAGSVLCFPHGNHPLHCLHSSEKITRGQKYIIRTDLLFPLN